MPVTRNYDLVICDESRMDKVTGAVAINCGALCGGNFPTSNLGVVFRGLADTSYEATITLTDQAVSRKKNTSILFLKAFINSSTTL